MLRTPRPASFLANVRRTWRRSLQLRVITISLAASTALMLTFGLVVSSVITSGLVNNRQAAARQSVLAGSDYAAQQLNSQIINPDDGFAGGVISNVVRALEGREVGAKVVIIPGQDPADDRADNLVVPAGPTLPADLREAAWKDGFASSRRELDLGQGDGTKLYLIFGRTLVMDWGQVQIYYLFALDSVVAQANLVTNTILATGVALVFLMVLVVFLVTRMVVRPVRVAARTAQRLSNGLLDQRMEVAGEDDLAALAASFNQMAENLQRHILRLEDMSRLQRRFTSDVSHELRTPLTTVRMAADLLFNTREDFEPAAARSAELLQAELDRFESLLAELLEISRFDAGFAALDSEPANLVPLVHRAVDRLQSVADRAEVTVEVDVPNDPVVAEVDVRRVERILRNLVGNAIEHSEGKPVKVRLAAREGAVAVTVRDHGVGLKPGDEKLVFNRFWRADPSRARQTGGTGLGLSISVEDARLHGGWLEAWGAPGQGAQFRLTLPSRAGDRLTSSPLRLIPDDFLPPTEALPEPRTPKALPAGPERTYPIILARPLSGDGQLSAAGTDRRGRLPAQKASPKAQRVARAPRRAPVGEGGRDDG
jgi:two-component system sensor histidine kinase MtrB